MSRFREELKVIPTAAWLITVSLYLAFVLFVWIGMVPHDRNLARWPLWGRALFATGVPLFVLILGLLIGYVNGDARRRGMRYVMWTLLAIFIPNAIGIILYFLLRDPPMRACSNCNTLVRTGFAYCPACGTSIPSSKCPHCDRPVESGWAHCPHCGTGLRAP